MTALTNARMERNWTPEQFWEFVEGYFDDWSAKQMRDALEERGLTIVPAAQITELEAELLQQYKEADSQMYQRQAAESRLTRVEAETVERIVAICETQKKEFLDPQYASEQPLGSFCERFAIDCVINAIIRSLAPLSGVDQEETPLTKPESKQYI